MRARAVDRESPIEFAICEYLFYKGYCFSKQNTRGFFQVQGGGKRGRMLTGHFRKDKNPFAKPGHPDILVVYRGFYGGFEVKSPTGRQSADQIEFEAYVTKKGEGFYALVCSLDEFIPQLERFTRTVDRLYECAGIDSLTQSE